VELDALHFRTGDDLVGALDVQILLGAAVLLLDRLEVDEPVELLAGRRMLAVALEEAFAFAAAEQVEQPPLSERKHDRREDLVIERGRADADVRLVVGGLGRPGHGVATLLAAVGSAAHGSEKSHARSKVGNGGRIQGRHRDGKAS
jgi:hypothetical protein